MNHATRETWLTSSPHVIHALSHDFLCARHNAVQVLCRRWLDVHDRRTEARGRDDLGRPTGVTAVVQKWALDERGHFFGYFDIFLVS